MLGHRAVQASESKQMSARVNRGLAWISLASSLVGLLDIIAILLILNLWVNEEEYGIATKCIWIIPLLDQATDLGLSAGVIQRDDHNERTLSTVFWLNLAIAAALFVVIVVTAPILATEFYGHAVVGWMLIAYSTKLLWQNVYFIPLALMKRELRFKELSVIRIIANLAEFGAKIGFAWGGFGIWCFVLGPLARVLVTGIGAQLRHPYRPRLVFRPREVTDHLRFGLKTSGSQVLFTFYTNIDLPIVGYYFGDFALGVYKLATEVVLEPVRIISSITTDIAFPAFARLRANKDRLIQQFVSFTRLNMITVMTYCAVVFVAAEDIFTTLFPSRASDPDVVRILCVVAIFRAVSFVLPPLLDGVGRPDRTLTYTATASVVMPVAYALGAIVLGNELGIRAVAVSWVVGYPVAFAVLLFLALHTLGWSTLAFLRAVGGVALCIVASAAVGWALHHFLAADLPLILRLPVSAAVILVGIGVSLAYTQGISLRSAARSFRST